MGNGVRLIGIPMLMVACLEMTSGSRGVSLVRSMSAMVDNAVERREGRMKNECRLST